MERCDWALLAALLLAGTLGTLTSALMVNDAAVFLAAGWFGNSWDLYFSQNADRWVATYVTYGPAWAARRLLDLSSGAYMVVAHIFYFAVPLVLWLVLRRIEPHRLFSRLYLAIALALIFFPTELIAGLGFWLMWMALVSNPARSLRQVAVATALFGLLMAFTHPSIALMSIVFVAVGCILTLLGRPLPRRSLVAATAMAALLLIAFVATGRWLKATNPTVIAALAVNRYAFIDPTWLTATLVLYPALAAQWLLLLMPGAQAARLRLPSAADWVVGGFGMCFAATGTGLLTWPFARHSAGYILALAVALALVAPAVWLAEARRALVAYALVIAVAATSFNTDLFFFGRFVDRYTTPGLVDIDDPGANWPPHPTENHALRTYLKWAAGRDYTRDVVVPVYDWHRAALAFYSFFRSDRQTVLFHRLDRRGDWLPFHCSAVARTLDDTRDTQDRRFLAFLGEKYCVP